MTTLQFGTLSEQIDTGFPEHDPSELRCLEQSVVADPQHEIMPAVVRDRKSGRIIDGKRQLEIRTKNGLAVKYVDVDCGDEWEQLQLMLQIQAGRRNLKPKQLAMCFATLRQLAGKFDNNEAAFVPLKTAAKKSGVSEKTMKLTNRVLTKGADVIVEGVRADRFTVSDAAGVVDLSLADQERVAAVATQYRITLKKAREHVMPKAATTDDDSPLSQASHTLQQLVSWLNGCGLLERFKSQLDAIEKAISDSAQPATPQPQPVEIEPQLAMV